MTGHSYLSASASHRWGHCPGSAVLSESMPNTSSPAAARGTELHAVAEAALRNGVHVAPLEDLQAVLPYTHWVTTLRGRVWLEQRVYYGDALGVDDDIAFGTADVLSLSEDGFTLTVGDLKTGGMHVEARDNTQLVLYAAGALAFLDMMGFDPPKNVRLVIVQPRISENPLVWEATVDDVLNVCMTLSNAAKIAVSQRGKPAIATLAPQEDACRWCPAAATCPALALVAKTFAPPKKQAVKASDFAPIQLSNNSLREHYEAVGVLRVWCDAIESEMFAATTRGETTGYKLVLGRQGNRRFTNEQTVEQVLAAQHIPENSYLNPPALMSPAQLDKTLKAYPQAATLIEPLIERPPGKPTLAPESDPRPAYVEDRAGQMIEKFKKQSP